MKAAVIVAHAGVEGVEIEDVVIGFERRQRRGVRYVVATMWVGGGMGAAALFEMA